MPLKCGTTLHAQTLANDGMQTVEGGAVEENLGVRLRSRHVAGKGNLEIWSHIREEKLVVTERRNPLESCGGDKETAI